VGGLLRLVALSCLAVSVPAVAAAAEWHLTPSAGGTFHGNTSVVDLEGGASKVHLQIGGSAGLVSSGVVGVEAIGVFTPAFFRGQSPSKLKYGRTFALMGNAVFTLPRRWTEYSLRPFVSGGLGLMRASLLDNPPLLTSGSLLPVKSNFAGYNVGGGAVGFLSARTGVRFDLRYYSSLHRPDQGPVAFGRVHLSYLTASIGIVLRR
jgi:hypothetical protein